MMKISGIYVIRNILTLDEYIGSSINITNRWWTHRTNLRGNRHLNPHLQNSWNKYSESSFVFEILEETSNLREREIYWIDKRKPELNCTQAIIRKDPDENGFVVTEETKEKIRKAEMGSKRGPLTEEHKRKLSAILHGHPGYNKGKHPSEEARKKMSLVRVGKPHTEEHKQKISEARRRFLNSPKGEEHCKHISEIQRGQPSHNQGHRYSDEMKAKLSEIQRALFQRKQLVIAMEGTP